MAMLQKNFNDNREFPFQLSSSAPAMGPCLKQNNFDIFLAFSNLKTIPSRKKGLESFESNLQKRL